MVPIPRRASSFLVVVFIHVNRKEEEEGETEQQQTYQFIQGNIVQDRSVREAGEGKGGYLGRA